MAKTLKLVNVTCGTCTKPLFAFHVKKGQTLMQSYGAAIRVSPTRLGVDRTATAVCQSCGAETEFDATLLPALKS